MSKIVAHALRGLIAALPLLVPFGLAAQQSQVTETLLRVRDATLISESGGRSYSNQPRVGLLRQLRGDTLILQPQRGGPFFELLVEDGSSIERRGRVPATGPASVWGAVLGGVLGGIIGNRTFVQEYREDCFLHCFGPGAQGAQVEVNSRGTQIAVGVFVGLAAGWGIGRILGSAFTIGGWVPLDRSELEGTADLVPTAEGRWEGRIGWRAR